MAKNKRFLTIDEDGKEHLWKCTMKPVRDGHKDKGFWNGDPDEDDDVEYTPLSSGTVKMLTGKELTWNDEPLEISVNIV